MMIHGFDSTDAGDGYVYFRYCSQPEYFNQYMPTNYVLCRYDKNGGGLEFIGNDNGVASFDYKDGYIYFADNGFKAVSEYEYTVDKDGVGIYSMKADGTDVKKLVSVKPESDEDKNDQTRILKNVVGRVEVIGDDLYYIAEDAAYYGFWPDGSLVSGGWRKIDVEQYDGSYKQQQDCICSCGSLQI